jgi:hypothetical protein
MTKEQFFNKRPIVEIYKGYEIRKYKLLYEVYASIGVYSCSSNYIEDCKQFIDKLVANNIKQYDNEAVAKYIFNKRK